MGFEIYSLGVLLSTMIAEPGDVGFLLSKKSEDENVFEIQVSSAAAEHSANHPSAYQSCFDYDDAITENLTVHRVFCRWKFSRDGFLPMEALTPTDEFKIPFGDPYHGHSVITPDHEMRIKGNLAAELMKFFEGAQSPPMKCEMKRYRNPTRSGGMRRIIIPVCAFKLPLQPPADASPLPSESTPTSTP